LNKDTNPILKKIGEKLKGRISTFKGHSHSFETKILLSEKAKKREKIECEYCKKKVTSGNLKRWHGENCKSKKINRLDNNFW